MFADALHGDVMKPFSYYDLVEAFAQPGCAICRLLQADARRFLESVFFEYVTDRDVQGAFRASRGLCNLHGGQLRDLKVGNNGVAILYEQALHEIVTLLEDLPHLPAQERVLGRLFGMQAHPQGEQIAHDLAAQEPCMCCAALDAGEKQYLAVLAEASAGEALRDAYLKSTGLCLPHFRGLLTQLDDRDQVRVFVEKQKAVWSSLIAELQLFRARIDTSGGVQPMGDEGTSWLRAIDACGGARGVFGAARHQS